MPDSDLAAHWQVPGIDFLQPEALLQILVICRRVVRNNPNLLIQGIVIPKHPVPQIPAATDGLIQLNDLFLCWQCREAVAENVYVLVFTDTKLL